MEAYRKSREPAFGIRDRAAMTLKSKGRQGRSESQEGTRLDVSAVNTARTAHSLQRWGCILTGEQQRHYISSLLYPDTNLGTRRKKGNSSEEKQLRCVRARSLQSWPTLCSAMDCSLPGSAVHGILQARLLEWVAMPSSRGSSKPRDRTQVSYISCTGKQVLYHYCHLGSPNDSGRKLEFLTAWISIYRHPHKWTY